MPKVLWRVIRHLSRDLALGKFVLFVSQGSATIPLLISILVVAIIRLAWPSSLAEVEGLAVLRVVSSRELPIISMYSFFVLP